MSALDLQHPVRSLIGAFAAWKTLLLAIAIGSGVGPAYDTSTTLVSPLVLSPKESAWDLATKLTRWDAIYYVQSARRGYLFEQEWAFGSGLPTVIAFFARAFEGLGFSRDESVEPLLGVLVAHASHLLSVLALYQLGLAVWGDRRLSLTAGLLHVLSPAGLFLSAPYAESPFALLSFLGYLFFAKGALGSQQRRTAAHDVSLVAAGLWFGVAATFRSNGVLGGVPFAFELLRELGAPPTLASVRRRLALLVGGAAVAVGFAAPQLVAYLTYCTGNGPGRPWCANIPPSIYSFVQEHYWNVGFLRYWTPGNIPLFLLAAPTLYLLIRSGLELLRAPSGLLQSRRDASSQSPEALARFVRSTALSQVALAALAITSYHVQIVARISSGYPLWYFWLAAVLGNPKSASLGSKVVIFMVMYAAIQGALFASFLPPA